MSRSLRRKSAVAPVIAKETTRRGNQYATTKSLSRIGMIRNEKRLKNPARNKKTREGTVKDAE
jgi:hypothetical protein